jgi:hypothetical protein
MELAFVASHPFFGKQFVILMGQWKNNFPQDEGSMMQLSENWARKRRERHGFATNMGTVLAVDGYVIEIEKPTATDLDGQEVSCYRNQKGFWGLITQVGCDCNGKVCFLQTDWPGFERHHCFRL